MKNKIIIFCTIFLAASGAQAADEKRNPIIPVVFRPEKQTPKMPRPFQMILPMAMDFLLRAPYSQTAVVIEPSEVSAFEFAAAFRNKRKFDAITASGDFDGEAVEPKSKRAKKYHSKVKKALLAQNINVYKWNCPCCEQLIINNKSSSQLWTKFKRHLNICKFKKVEQTIDVLQDKFAKEYPETKFRGKRGAYKKHNEPKKTVAMIYPVQELSSRSHALWIK